MQPGAKPGFTIISEPMKGEEARNARKRFQALLDDMAARARETGLTEEQVTELLKNDG